MPQESLTITDSRTGKSYTVPVENGTIRAMDLRQIKTGAEDFGLMTYDPAFMNTASCRSASTYIEVAYLILFGELPAAGALKKWVFEITHHTMLHETTKKFMEGFRDTA